MLRIAIKWHKARKKAAKQQENPTLHRTSETGTPRGKLSKQKVSNQICDNFCLTSSQVNVKGVSKLRTLTKRPAGKHKRKKNNNDLHDIQHPDKRASQDQKKC